MRVAAGSLPSSAAARPVAASAMYGLWNAPETATFIARPPASRTSSSSFSHAVGDPATTVCIGLL